MAAEITPTTVFGFDALVLENAKLRAVILPSLGGRVWELTDRQRERQWIWHRPDVPLATSGRNAVYDDVWAGGWEELFPNDAAGRFENRELPDHGIWWSTSWSARTSSDVAGATVTLTANIDAPACSCTKTFHLATDASTITVRYRIESHEREPFHFLFKQHLPIAINPRCRLDLPGGRATPVDPTFSLLTNGAPFDWPFGSARDGRRVDVRNIPAAADALREFLYVGNVGEGRCGVVDESCHAALHMRYDEKQLPFVWFFLTYGGWRDCYTAVLEPCTNMPKDLSEAVRLGQSARLEPGGVFEIVAEVTLSAATEAE